MAIQTINVGTTANDGTGDTLRDSFIKCNNNFTDELVPYIGANSSVDLGSNDLYTNKVYLYDEANDNHGSIHYSDGDFHIEDGDGHKMFVIEDGFVQLHLTDTIQSNLFTSELTQTRDHYLPDSSGTLATNETILSGVTTQNLNLVEDGGTYSSSIKSEGMSADWELLTPDSSGTIATEDKVNELLDIGLETKQDKIFYLKSLAPSSVVTGTLSETQVFRGQINANTFNVVGDYLNLNAIISKVGTASSYTIKIKLSQSATMPSGTTDQIAIYNGPTTILTAQMIRNFAFLVYTDGFPRYSLEGHSFTSSAIIDLIASTNAFSRVEYSRGSTYYLYVSIQLTGSSADSVTLRSLKATNL